MRIQTDQKIVGYPALQVRQLMRETVGRPITLRYVQEILKCSDSSARRVMRKLEVEGFAQSVHGHLEPSTKGSALAMAKAAPPLRRETAERLISDIIDRVRAVNRAGEWVYRIKRLVIFGSYVRGADRSNDVDILIPPAVLAELKHPLAPKLVRDWAANAPRWLEILSPKSSLILPKLDLGEAEAIALATEVSEPRGQIIFRSTRKLAHPPLRGSGHRQTALP